VDGRRTWTGTDTGRGIRMSGFAPFWRGGRLRAFPVIAARGLLRFACPHCSGDQLQVGCQDKFQSSLSLRVVRELRSPLMRWRTLRRDVREVGPDWTSSDEKVSVAV
jgi:hypothetical protein